MKECRYAYLEFDVSQHSQPTYESLSLTTITNAKVFQLLNVASSTLSRLVKEIMSNFFSRLFNKLAKKKEPQPTMISFRDFSSEVISPFVEFMYTMELPVEVIRLYPMEFFILGSLYEVDTLLIHVAYCPSIVTEGNVGKILELGEKYGAKNLLRRANLYTKNRGCEGLNRSPQGLDTLVC